MQAAHDPVSRSRRRQELHREGRAVPLMAVATRVSRGAAGRRRRAAASLAAVLTAAAGVYAISRLGDVSGGGAGPAPVVGSASTSELLVLQVVGTDDPMLALVDRASAIGHRRSSRCRSTCRSRCPGKVTWLPPRSPPGSTGSARGSLEHVRGVGRSRGRS